MLLVSIKNDANQFENKQNQRGFSLVELLIAMVIFSLLMVLVSSATNITTRFWLTENVNLENKIAETIRMEKLYRAIKAIQPYSLYYQRVNASKLFFEGTEDRLTFVSSKGINVNEPVIMSLKIENTREQGVAIFFAERTLASTPVINDPDLANIEWQWSPFISQLESASFSYYGYLNLSQIAFI